MTYLTILEKLQILFNTILNFKVVLSFIVVMLLITILYTFKVLNKKKYSILMSISFVLLFGISIISNYKILSNTFDNFMTIFFREIYFPSIYIYIAMLIISIITFITSILSKTLKRTYKIINITNFIINNILLVIILNIIAKNKTDIFSVNSLYTNTNLVAILEISTSLFLIWAASIIITYATNVICNKLTKKTRVVTTSDVVEDEVFTNIEDEKIDHQMAYITSNNTNTVIDLPKEILSNEKEAPLEEKNTYAYELPNIKEGQLSLFEEIEEPSVEDISSVEEPVLYTNEVKHDLSKEEQLSLLDEEGKPISYVSNIEKEESSKELTINDILSTIVPVEYDNNNYTEVYEIANPREIYEDNYNNNESLQTLANEVIDEPSNDNILPVTNISYNKEILEKNENNNFSLDDYKKIAKMLKEIKNYTSNNTLTVEDAINLTLISNYSIDDCIKFKDILESSLN